jgi:SAM-dependent methyltransferase
LSLWEKILGRSSEQSSPVPAATVPAQEVTAIPIKDAMMNGWFNNATQELFEGFRVGPEDVVADIGCGGGGYAEFCARHGANLILIDIEPETVAAAAAKAAAIPTHGRIEHYASDSDPLPIADAACSRIICTEVIEHVDSAERLMAELARIGRPGAQYLLTCPDPGSEALQKRLAAPSYFEKPQHVRVLEHEAFARLVEGAGLVIERRHSGGFFWNLWLALFWGCKVPIERPEHELLESWTHSWGLLLNLPDGPRIKQALDDLMPRNQLILARKPG